MTLPQIVTTFLFLLFLGFLFLLALSPARAEEYLITARPPHSGEGASYVGWIPIQYLAQGETLPLDLHRFLQARDGDRIAIGQTRGCNVSLDEASFQLRVRVAKDTRGILELPIRLYPALSPKAPLEALLVLAVRPSGGHLFRYRAASPDVQQVMLAGDFNSWNASSTPLTRKGPRQFELYVPLASGEQEYKFVVDGEWLTDPSAPRATNGNSLVKIPELPKSTPPHLFAETVDGDTIAFRAVGGRLASDRVQATLQHADGTSLAHPLRVEGDRVMANVAGAPEGSWLRVIATGADGTPGNTVRVQTRSDGSFQWADAVLYYAFTDRFVNGNPENDRPVVHPQLRSPANFHGGDFDGIRQRIEEGYFKNLGVNVVWISPVHRNPDGAWQEYLEPNRYYTGYHGYWPVSHTEIEPRFGGKAALEALIATAKRNDTRIMADLVLKHVHIEHPLWREKPEWFGPLLLPDGSKNLRRWDSHQFTTWFEEWLPGFDFSQDEPVRFLLDNALDFATRFQLDGYRLDAVKHIPPAFWWKFRSALRDQAATRHIPPRYCVGETFMDRRGIMSFVGPNMLDGQFDFPLYDVLIDVFARHIAGFEALETALAASERAYGKETLMSPLLGNHDKSRFVAFADGDVPDPDIPDEEELGWVKPPRGHSPAAYERLKLAFSFLFSVDGVPMLYYGDEVGMTGAGDPDNRRMMPLESALTPEQKSLRAHVSTVANIRRDHPALRYGSRRVLEVGDTRYAFLRRHLQDTVLVAWNRSDQPASFTLTVAPEFSDGPLRDALSGMTLQVAQQQVRFTLPPMTSAFLIQDKAP